MAGLFDNLTEEEKAKLYAYVGSTPGNKGASGSWDEPTIPVNQEVIAPIAKPRAPTAKVSEPVVAPESSVAPSIQPTSEMNPQVKDYLMKKFNLGEYSDENRKKLVDESSGYDFGGRASAALAALGAGFMGKDAGAAGNAVLDRQRADRNQKLSEFDKGRANKIQEFGLDREVTRAEREDEKYVRDQELLQREKDPTSPESVMAQQLAKRMGFQGDASKLTAEQFKAYSPVLSKMYDIEQKKLDRQEAREERRFQSGIKMDEKMEQLKTPYGVAITPDDAKQLKGAYELKKSFDNKIDQMIALRKKHDGGATLNRDDVGRGKQLSKDLLLAYKELAKLGVLSVADENILNTIIPEDPLAYNSPVAAIQGQDPILHKMEKFKEDSNTDFDTRVQTRTRSGKPEPVGSSSKSGQYPKQLRKGSQIATVSNAQEEKEAKSEGWQ